MQNNFKRQQEQQQENQKVNLLNFLQMQDKSASSYINMITSDDGINKKSDTERLEAMVRTQLKREFPNIENKKSYEFLVTAVMHNYKKKQLQAIDRVETK